MKNPWLFSTLLSLCLCCCKEKAPQKANDSTSTFRDPLAENFSSPTPVPKQVILPTQATPEQLASTVRLRVAFGGMPPRDVPAALLHRDEIPNKVLVQGKERFVLALLKGWAETQLRSPSGRLIVYRNKVNAQGVTVAVAFPARLVQFNPETHQAVVTYLDDFSYSEDAGFHLEFPAPGSARRSLLRLISEPEPVAAESRPPPLSGLHPSNRTSGFTVETGAYTSSDEKSGTIHFAPSTQTRSKDRPLLVVGAPDRLIGFVEQSDAGTGGFIPVEKSIVDVATPVLKTTAIAFGKLNGYMVEFELFTEPAVPELVPRRASLRFHEAPEASLEAAARPGADGTFTPLETASTRDLQRDAKTGTWKGAIAAPELGAAKTLLVQMSWPLFDNNSSALAYGQPFLLQLERRPDGVYPTVRGLSVRTSNGLEANAPAGLIGQNTAPAVGEVKKLALEGRVRNTYVLADGREILFELEDAPYWKWFSFEKNDWRSLPPGNPANLALTGNLRALFVLDRASGEVRKYRLADLEPQGTTKLPPASEYLTILAGANSEHAPVHVLSTTDALALAPETLQRRDVPRLTKHPNSPDFRFTRNARYAVTGDGLGIARLNGEYPSYYCYNADAQGLQTTYFDLPDISDPRIRGVSTAFSMSDWLRCMAVPSGVPFTQAIPQGAERAGAKTLAPNSPTIFHLTRANVNTVPPQPPRVSCYSYFDDTPFAEVDAPELGDVRNLRTFEQEPWAFFDPASLRLATFDAEKKNLFIRQLAEPEHRTQPVLLNWPDTSLVRGGQFQFRPRLLGGKKFTAEILGQPGLATVDEAAGTVQFPVGETSFESLLLLNLRVPNAHGAVLNYLMPLHVSGPSGPFVARPGTELKGINFRGAGFRSLDSPAGDFRPLRAAIHLLAEPVAEMLGPIADCLALVTDTNRVDFFSLRSRKVIGSTSGPPGACYYAGSGALLEYDPGKKSLTRITVPDGRRTAMLTLPANVTLDALGCGTESNSPVTLAISITASQATTRLGDLTVTETQFRRAPVVVDGNTLRAAGWTQPATLTPTPGPAEPLEPLAHLTPAFGKRPAILPASHNGRIVHLPHHFLALASNYAVAIPFATTGTGFNNVTQANGRRGATGSLSGLMAISTGGEAFKGGIPVGTVALRSFGGTPCGRYHLNMPSSPFAAPVLQIRLAETDRPLMLAARFSCLDENAADADANRGRRLAMLGDEGPLALLSASRLALELVDLNIPTLAKNLLPDEFHVVSQPIPCVVEGGMLQYQVQTNNPAAVRSCRLQTPVPGASLSSQGLLQYTAPVGGAAKTPTYIAIEITGSSGQTVLHEFPIYILPSPRGYSGSRPYPL